MTSKNPFRQSSFGILAALMLSISLSLFSQAEDNSYFFNDVDSTQAYESVGFCRTLNYYWDQGVVDHDGTIYFVYVDNYELWYYQSSDEGVSWEAHQVVTGNEGYIHNAMAALTQDDSLVIVYSLNTAYVNGTVSFASEFMYDIYGAVQSKDGWKIELLRAHSGNSGLLPYGTITTKSGLVHVLMHKYGWYNYGGELYEIMYDPEAGSWTEIETIKIFSDRTIDRGTNYVCKLAEGQDDKIIGVYQRHAAVTGYVNLEVIVKDGDGWSQPQVILGNSSYSTYNRFDLDYDRHGHFYLTYFIPFGENGPEIYMAHNSVSEFTKYELFAPQDTLRKISVHPYPDAVAYVYVNFKDSLPKILRLDENGLEPTGFLPAFGEDDSTDVMRFHYNVPMKNNFAPDLGLLGFTNRSRGKEGNTVLRYPIVFVRTNLEEYIEPEEPIAVPEIAAGRLNIYPNPGKGIINIGQADNEDRYISIYNSSGMLIRIIELAGSGRQPVDISELPAGIYLLRDQADGKVSRYVKQ